MGIGVFDFIRLNIKFCYTRFPNFFFVCRQKVRRGYFELFGMQRLLPNAFPLCAPKALIQTPKHADSKQLSGIHRQEALPAQATIIKLINLVRMEVFAELLKSRYLVVV